MAGGENKDSGQILKEVFEVSSESLRTINISSLVPESYNSILLSYTGDDLTEVIYKENGFTVATLDLTYSSGKLIQVVRS